MKQLFSKAGVSSLAFVVIFIVITGMFVMNIFENNQERKETLTEIKNAGTPIELWINQDINWKNSMNSMNKISWTDGKSYNFDKSKSIEEQNVPDFITLTQSDEKYPTKSCSEKYDVCGAVMRVKDANTGEVITTIKDEEMVDKGDTMFSILGSLIEEETTTTTSNRVWEGDLENDPAITKLYTDLTYDVEIYTIKDGERVVDEVFPAIEKGIQDNIIQNIEVEESYLEDYIVDYEENDPRGEDSYYVSEYDVSNELDRLKTSVYVNTNFREFWDLDTLVDRWEDRQR